MQPRTAAWECPACADDCAVLLYASTLHNVGWLPTHSASLGPALALELQLADRLVAGHPGALLTGAASCLA